MIFYMDNIKFSVAMVGSSKFCSYVDKLSVVVLFRCFVCAYVCKHMLKVFKFASQLNYSEGQVTCGYMLCMLPSRVSLKFYRT